MNIKGVAKVATNIKPMAGGNAIAVLQVGEYVYGEWSATRSDIINFSHYYKTGGTKVELGQLCKVYVGTNLTTSVEEEPTNPPTEPPPDAEKTIMVIIKEDGYQDATVTVRQIPL